MIYNALMNVPIKNNDNMNFDRSPNGIGLRPLAKFDNIN